MSARIKDPEIYNFPLEASRAAEGYCIRALERVNDIASIEEIVSSKHRGVYIGWEIASVWICDAWIGHCEKTPSWKWYIWAICSNNSVLESELLAII